MVRGWKLVIATVQHCTNLVQPDTFSLEYHPARPAKNCVILSEHSDAREARDIPSLLGESKDLTNRMSELSDLSTPASPPLKMTWF